MAASTPRRSELASSRRQPTARALFSQSTATRYSSRSGRRHLAPPPLGRRPPRDRTTLSVALHSVDEPDEKSRRRQCRTRPATRSAQPRPRGERPDSALLPTSPTQASRPTLLRLKSPRNPGSPTTTQRSTSGGATWPSTATTMAALRVLLHHPGFSTLVRPHSLHAYTQ